jgi:hypothetical protein
MSIEETGYSVYVRFYLALHDGHKPGAADYSHSANPEFNLGQSSIPFNEEQIVAAAIAIDDFNSGLSRRTKREFLSEFNRLIE